MTDTNSKCSPGSHPHSDRPNWRPAETIDEYFENCRDGVEKYSERRVAKLMGMTPIEAWRARVAAEIPEALFEHIMQEHRRLDFSISLKALAQVALALRRGKNDAAEVQCCPHCGGVLRIRALVSKQLLEVVNQWLFSNRA
jgi:hypothetical protein